VLSFEWDDKNLPEGRVLYLAVNEWMVRVLENVDIRLVLQRIEDLEKRLDAIEEVIEALIPEDDENFVIEEYGEVREYKRGEFLKWGKERGLVD